MLGFNKIIEKSVFPQVEKNRIRTYQANGTDVIKGSLGTNIRRKRMVNYDARLRGEIRSDIETAYCQSLLLFACGKLTFEVFL